MTRNDAHRQTDTVAGKRDRMWLQIGRTHKVDEEANVEAMRTKHATITVQAGTQQ